MSSLTAKKRADGRDANQLRALSAERGLLNRADGSSRLVVGESKLMVAVYGPGTINKRLEKMDKATLQVTFRPVSGFSGSVETELESFIQSAVEPSIMGLLHPRTGIQIVIQVQHSDGSELANAINASTLALIDAGVALKTQVVASTCALLSDGTLILDPTLEEETSATAVLTFAFDKQMKGVVATKASGYYSEETFFRCLEACRHSAAQLLSFFELGLRKKLESSRTVTE